MPGYARFGWTRSTLGLYIPIPAGTDLVELVTDFVLGYKAHLEKASFVTAVAGVGSSASAVLRVVKGASTVMATGTLTEASTSDVGEKTALTVTDDDTTNFLDDTDTLTVDYDASTAFTAGAGNLLLVFRTQPQQR